MSLLPCWALNAVVPLLSIEGQRVFFGWTVPLMFNIRFRVKNVNVAESSYSVFSTGLGSRQMQVLELLGPLFERDTWHAWEQLNQQFQFQYLFCKERREYRQLCEQYISAKLPKKKTGHVVFFFFTGCCQIHDLFLKSVETHGQFAIGFGSPAQELGLECELFWWKRD